MTQEIEVLKSEIVELTQQSQALAARLDEAREKKAKAQVDIVAGKDSASRRSSEASELIAALTPELSKVQSLVAAKQSRIVRIQAAAAHSAKMDDLAMRTSRCGISQQNLQKHFDEAVSAVRVAFASMDAAREELIKHRQEFALALRANVKDFDLRQAHGDTTLNDEMSQLAREMQQRGASLDDGLAVFWEWGEQTIWTGFSKQVSLVQSPTPARSIERSVQLVFNEKLR